MTAAVATYDDGALNMVNKRNFSFDTLKYANKLKAVGTPEKQAEVQAELQAEVITQQVNAINALYDNNLATKQDIDELRRATKQDIDGLRQATKQDIDELRQATKQGIDELRRATKQDIDELRQATKQDIDELKRTTKQDIDELRQATKQDISGCVKDMELKLLLKFGSLMGFMITTSVIILGYLIKH